MRITVFDYGAGNLHSLAKVLQGGTEGALLAAWECTQPSWRAGGASPRWSG